jgi:hypothetical protein
MQQLKNGKKDVQGVQMKSIRQGNRHKPLILGEMTGKYIWLGGL